MKYIIQEPDLVVSTSLLLYVLVYTSCPYWYAMTSMESSWISIMAKIEFENKNLRGSLVAAVKSNSHDVWLKNLELVYLRDLK